ncbi:myb family transcription factor EFM-like [Aristolochia californica]|uniref:myb family transcription factor EFM-like n=1 Tax=Aristolochia californica TaxID=171875 RepID=UPI0035D7155F
MASPSELTLECKPKSYATLLKFFGDQAEHQKLEEILSRLEEERLKIDGFKRELPLCMQLLNNALEASRQQLDSYQVNQGSRPVLEEFMPLKNPNTEEADKTPNMSEKANWMTSAQLWSQANDGNKHQGTVVTSSVKETDHGFSVSPKLALDNKQRNGGAFLPFSKERSTGSNTPIRALPDLALASTDKEPEENICSESEKGTNCSRRESTCTKGSNGEAILEQGKGAVVTTEGQPTSTTTAQAHRKARRCWSPDLHRRFVNALQMLGGSQVATPKQIRELMKVDGLTNDEVKSHLQKYRLHTRRPSPAPQAPTNSTPQLVVLGGIWVPPEYATAAAAHGAGPAIYGAHPASHASTHYCTQPPVAQDFYPALPHALHPNLHHAYKVSSQAHNLPESDVRRLGDRSESIEDGKSESSSWKGDSGDNDGGGPKGLLSLRDDGEESNGSEITLKF